MKNRDIAIIFGAFAFIFSFLAVTFFSPNYYTENEPISFDISTGESLTQISDSLYIRGVISSKFLFKITAIIMGMEGKIKAGRYKIPNGLSYIGLVSFLNKGEILQQIKLMIPEGSSQSKIAEIVDYYLNIDIDEFLSLSKDKNFLSELGIVGNNIEGYLLPETYYFFEDSDAKAVIKKLFSENLKIYNRENNRLREIGFSWEEVLILASIIDAESNYIPEFKRISGVYHNRLKIGMKLQADPTVAYIIRDQNKKLHRKYFSIDSPYNTYLYQGLPPSPINNPGKDAILAALYPEEHDYFYFVADGTGKHAFSKSFDEHLRKVSVFRK